MNNFIREVKLAFREMKGDAYMTAMIAFTVIISVVVILFEKSGSKFLVSLQYLIIWGMVMFIFLFLILLAFSWACYRLQSGKWYLGLIIVWWLVYVVLLIFLRLKVVFFFV